jgi:hypothetical protein
MCLDTTKHITNGQKGNPKKKHTKLGLIIMGTYNVGEMKHIYVFIVGREAYLGFYVGESSMFQKNHDGQ